MTSSNPAPIVLHADQEHDSLRTAVILFLITFFFLSYWLVYAILQLEFWGGLRDYAVSLSCVLGLTLALAISAGVEILLKRVWHSGRNLTLIENSIHVQDKFTGDQLINLTEGLAHLKWHFYLQGYRRGGREKRLSPKWVCLAYQLQQGDTRLIVHSYLPPQKAKVWLENEANTPKFHEIKPGDVYQSSLKARMGAPARPRINNKVLGSSDGRYWLAERHRWDEGFELTPNDFAIFMDYIAREKSES
jgi:hypothetical protein